MKMKKNYNPYTAMILAAMMLTGCGDTAADVMETVDNKTNGIFSYDSAKSEDHASSAASATADGAEHRDAGFAAADVAEYGDAEFEAAEEALPDDVIEEPPVEVEPSKEPPVEIEPPEEPPVEIEPIENDALSFVLTAGEWNDNENWGFFANLIHNNTITFPSYGLQPMYRVAVNVTNGGTAVANQAVTLLRGDESVWSAKTDKNGKAYLFYDESCTGQDLNIQTAGAEAVAFTAPEKANAQGGSGSVPTLEYTIETGEASQTYTETEVCFILDTTGSMGDEITYLQKDFSSIAEAVSAEGVTFSVNFYRDEGDDYVTRCNPFTDDVKSAQKALNQEYADGGGDEPEAVAEILHEVLVNGDWHENTNKIAFLIYDAPPHHGDAQAEMICNAVRTAAEQGIHVVPVVASNAARDTELFGRALSIMTNANYVFLTDDSGVGGSHMEPIIGDYDVELLHDIIVRNILEIAT